MTIFFLPKFVDKPCTVGKLWHYVPLCRQLCAVHDRTQHAESHAEKKSRKKLRGGGGGGRACVCWARVECTYI